MTSSKDSSARTRQFDVTSNDDSKDTLFEFDLHSLESIDEFKIEKVVGSGGFGIVYLAWDNSLDRHVALKLPHHRHISEKKQAEEYLREAKTLASLQHPNVATVYKIGGTDSIPCYIVSEYIEGVTLKEWCDANQPSFEQIAELTATVARTLDFAHSKTFIHRDVKLSNILVDSKDKVFLVDFGLTVSDFDVADLNTCVGTPKYMSPEQVAGEGHHITHKTDIYSLGVVLYWMLTKKFPFDSDYRIEIFRQIQSETPPSPRSVDTRIPAELERICLRAMSKSRSERYSSAAQMAQELDACAQKLRSARGAMAKNPTAIEPETANKAALQEDSCVIPVGVIPKSLRPYDFRDADYFMHLLPGPRGPDRMPESVRFWVSHLSQREAKETFSVGLLYGPSGCGKTSMVRAAIRPNLDPTICTVYVECTARQTEAHIRELLNKSFRFEQDRTLPQMLQKLRLDSSRKVVLILDQFEQWLDASLAQDAAFDELTLALRQCDGGNVQCVLMVREDFLSSATRFMKSIDINIAEGGNALLMDLFDAKHARTVLAAFGTAYGALPTSEKQFTVGNEQFLDEAISSLSTNNRVICVQLTVLAEMLKSQKWDNPSLVKGDAGRNIGARYLEQLFHSESSPQRYRDNVAPIRRILKQLLPTADLKIKGSRRTSDELYAASGCSDFGQFEKILRMLDSELRLITPTDRLDKDRSTEDKSGSESAIPSYQLTHDFLVSAMQHWIQLHEMGTRTGQAQARLDEYAEVYRFRPRAQAMPSLMDYVNIRRHLHKSSWTEAQSRFMEAASSYFRKRALLFAAFALFLISLSAIGFHQFNTILQESSNDSNIENLKNAQVGKLSDSLRAINLRNSDALSKLNAIYSNPDSPPRNRFRAALAIRDKNPKTLQTIADYMKSADSDEILAVGEILKDDIARVANLILSGEEESTADDAYLRAGALQSMSSLPGDRFKLDAHRLSNLIVRQDSIALLDWIRAFRPYADSLMPPLAEIASSSEPSSTERANAAICLSQYATSPATLTPVIRKASIDQLPILLSSAHLGKPEVLDALSASINVPIQLDWDEIPPDNLVQEELQEIELETLQMIEQAGGIADSKFVIVHSLQHHLLEKIDASVARAGYRLALLRPYQNVEQNYVAATWLRDGRTSQFLLDKPADFIRKRYSQLKTQGYFPADLSGRIDASGNEVLYAMVFTHPSPHRYAVDSGLFIDLREEELLPKGIQPFDSNNFVSRACIRVILDDGTARYSAIRWKMQPGVDFIEDFQIPTEQYSNILELKYPTVHIGKHQIVTNSPRLQEQISSVWWNSTETETRDIPTSAFADHRRACLDLAAQGYRPQCISVENSPELERAQYSSIWMRPLPKLELIDQNAREDANAILALISAKQYDQFLKALSSDEHLETRAYLINTLNRISFAPDILCNLATTTDSIDVANSLVQALALYRPASLSPKDLGLIEESTRAIAQRFQHSGLHSSAKLLATKLMLPALHDHLNGGPSRMNSNESYTTTSGHRMLVIDASKPFLMGSPPNEVGRDGAKEWPHFQQIGRSFAMSDCEITVSQYLEFDPDFVFPIDYSAYDDSPIVSVTWFDAVRYCRYISELEGIAESQMCYPAIEEIGPDMILPDDFLDRHGYRLPTEAEWEFACRGNTLRPRFFGFAPELLDEYAWTPRNSNYRSKPVAQLLPNPFGFFDILGNTMEWCNDGYHMYPILSGRTHPDVLDGNRVGAYYERATRGGAFLYQPLNARAAQRDSHGYDKIRPYLSFRLARTTKIHSMKENKR